MIPRPIARLFSLVFLSAIAVAGQAQTPAPAQISYQISLAHSADHLVEVAISLPPGSSDRSIQMPVWNALYQVRDFAQYVNWVKAESPSGQLLPIHKLDKTTWQISGAQHGARVKYETFADQAGPFGAQLNSHHVFFNFAEILMYQVGALSSPASIRFTDVPSGWHIATALTAGSQGAFEASNYDRLVDSPVELGDFRETSFDEAGAHYRIAVDADSNDYDLDDLSTTLHRIIVAATGWMQDRPFQNYLFIYHFPRGPAGGGMEHAYSTAIDLSAERIKRNPASLDDVTAHEFFHLWNVKRIRPQSLEPIDYTRENYTTALWFSEGFTSTVGNYIRLRAGLLNETRFLELLAGQIAELERLPAHRTQSVEESSLDAWFEKYSHYRLPERSISYYNKGLLVGVLLDLQMREASHGRATLRDLFQWMNQHYAKQNRFFADTAAVRQAAETVAHADLGAFFERYVSGTDEIPYDDFFRTVGLRLVRRDTLVADLGAHLARNFGSPPTVVDVRPSTGAERAGLTKGDSILKIESQPATGNLDQELGAMNPGDTVHLTVRNAQGDHDLSFKLDGRQEVEFELKDVDNVTPQQHQRRAAWLAGETQQP